jgi:hypothetical protein
MAGSSDHNSAKPRPGAQSPIYLCSTCHEESEYVVKSQKFFPIFSLVVPKYLVQFVFMFETQSKITKVGIT